MASRGDGVTPQLKLSEFWHATFDRIFQVFRPDEWTLEPTDRGMLRDWRQFKDSAKVKFLCDCGNSWTSMMGRIIFWYKRSDEKNNKKELKTEEEKCTSDEGQKDEPKETNKYSLRFRLYGQQCKMCENGLFINPQWYEDEVKRVLQNVHKKIGKDFYEFPQEDPNNRKRHGRMRQSHDSRRCQACQEGQCNS
ncbi:receptor-transporting protein 3-like [Pocillopora verrucosa]|uniref:receptor-transporting protein 3-like n=1 Tax=Pocillopora verrucosa TaxID=203993 RepID=UPI0033422F9D